MNLQIPLAIALIAVTGVLGWGILNMAKGGAKGGNPKEVSRSNMLMRWRIGLQALALVILMVAFYLKSKG